MSKVASIDIDVNVSLNVSDDTAATCLGILNQYFKNNPGCRLSESKDVDSCSIDPIYSYDMEIPF